MNRPHLSALRRYYVLLLAGLAATILVTPQLMFRFEVGPEFHHLSFAETDEEGFYYARVHEIYDGHWAISNAFSAEYKDKPILHFGLLEIVTGALGRVFGLHIDTLMIVSKFVFGALLFLFIYWFVYQIVENSLVGVTAAAAVMFGLTAILRPWMILSTYLDVSQAMFLQYSRAIQPAGSSALFFAALALLFLYVDRRRERHLVLFGAVLALSFYVYIYTWTFLITFVGLLFIALLALRRTDVALKLGLCVVVACAAGSYLFMELWRASRDIDYATASLRFGGVQDHHPILSVTAVCCLLSMALYRMKHKHFMFPLYLTPLVVHNQQILTGRTLHTGHYHWYFHEPLFVIIALVLAYQYLRRYRVVTTFVFAGALCVFFLLATAQQFNAYQRWYEPYFERQKLGEAYEWLDSNTPRDSVVLAEDIISLTGYTHNNSYLNYPWTLVPQERLIEDYFIKVVLFNDPPGHFRRDAQEKAEMSRMIFGGHYHEDCRLVREQRLDISYPCFDDEALDPIYRRYEEMGDEDVLAITSRNQLDYVLVRKETDSRFLRQENSLFRNMGYAIYKWESE